jgi:hypothetical protein
VRKFKKVSNKYKGKFPFKCFNCGNIGHFSTKRPYAKDESSDDDEDFNINKGRKNHQHKKNHKHDKNEKKKTLISRRRVSTQKGLVTRLKKEENSDLIVIEKKLSLWK